MLPHDFQVLLQTLLSLCLWPSCLMCLTMHSLSWLAQVWDTPSFSSYDFMGEKCVWGRL